MKASAFKGFNIGYFVLCLLVLSCLSYGCGGGARDLIILESQKKYVSAVVNTCETADGLTFFGMRGELVGSCGMER